MDAVVLQAWRRGVFHQRLRRQLKVGQRRLQLLQLLGQRRHRRPLILVFDQQPPHQRHNARRQPRRKLGQRGRRLIDMLGHQRARARRHKRHPPRQQPKHHHAQRIDVGLVVDSARPRTLLRRHIPRRPHQQIRPRRRRLLLAGGVELGDAKVQHLRPLSPDHGGVGHDHDVVGFQIAVHDALGVGCGQRRGHLLQQPQRVLQAQAAVQAADALAQGLAG